MKAIFASCIVLVAAIIFVHRADRAELLVPADAPLQAGLDKVARGPRAGSSPPSRATDASASPGIAWGTIRTNGAMDLSRISTDLEYQLRVRRHVQLRALLNFKARDSDDLRAVSYLVERYGYGPDLIPMAYLYSWQRADHERTFPSQNGRVSPDAAFRIGMLDTDFLLHLERGYGNTSQEFIQELQRLHPTTDFGVINTTVANGEPFYE